MRAPVATVVAIGVGLILMLGYFLPIEPLRSLRTTLLDLAMVLAAVAGLIAILNLAGIHWRRFRAPKGQDPYSAIFLIAFAITFLAALALGPAHPQVQRVITSIQIPVETSLLAVVGISLVYAAIRLFQRRRGLMPVVFLISTLVFLVLASGIPAGLGDVPFVRDIMAILNRLPMAGARGILLGVALGGLTTGLRVLLGADRPYSG